jgi:hypothetical protein
VAIIYIHDDYNYKVHGFITCFIWIVGTFQQKKVPRTRAPRAISETIN